MEWIAILVRTNEAIPILDYLSGWFRQQRAVVDPYLFRILHA
jgi:hypothetical protein